MFSNRFNTKNDPLLEAAEAAMRDGDLRRQAEGIVNEAFGVYNRKAVVNEHLVDYDAAIEEVYAGLKEGVLDSIGSYLKNPTPTQKAVQGAAQGAADRATGGMLGKLGSALSVGGSSAAPSGQTKNIREGKPNDGNLANNYPPYDKVTRGDVVAGRLGKDQMGGKRKMAEGTAEAETSMNVTRDNKPSTPAQTNASTSGPSASDKAALASKIKTMKEEEQLDELSRKTLKSYKRKATTSADRAWSKADREEDRAMATDGDKYPYKQERHMKNAAGHVKTWQKRDAGLRMADKRLKEEEQLDELKRSTLTSYIRKAARAKATPENISKRSKGLGLAAKKLEKLDEERKRTSAVADAFMAGKKANQKTLRTDGKTVTYHGNTIAKHEGDEVHVTTAGYGHSPSTRGHVSGILRRLGAPGLSQKKGQLYHGDKPVGSSDWIKVKKTERSTFGEDTQLDEISKRTLGSYVKKASHDVATRSAETRGAAMKADQAREKQDYMGARRHEERSNKMFNKSWKRRKGIAKAIDRLTKEDIQLDELSAFGAEFAKQRAAGAKQFTFGGKSYTTALKSPTAKTTPTPTPSSGMSATTAAARTAGSSLPSMAAAATPTKSVTTPGSMNISAQPAPVSGPSGQEKMNIMSKLPPKPAPTTTPGSMNISAQPAPTAGPSGQQKMDTMSKLSSATPAATPAPSMSMSDPKAKQLKETVQIGDTKYRIV